ncbi:hypothetical protein D3C73_1413540 [compost metagenome]
MGQMLSVAVCADYIAGQPSLLNILEPALQRPSFSEIADMRQYMTAEGFCRLEDSLVSLSAAVIHNDDRAELIVLQLYNQIEQPLVWFVGRN